MNMMSLPKTGFAGEDLRDAWLQLRLEQPRLRIRDAAALLNVSEAELLYASNREAVVRLRPDWRELFDALPAFGRLMALTRNENCVHERYGEYNNIRFSANGQMGLVVNGAHRPAAFHLRVVNPVRGNRYAEGLLGAPQPADLQLPGCRRSQDLPHRRVE